jgi:uncharacterized protein (TIGR03435 family)
VFLIVVAGSLCGQRSPEFAFEAASVKPSAPLANGADYNIPPRGGPGTSDPGQITWSKATLMSILRTAYSVKNYQVYGPDWLRTERYDIVAKLPPGASKEQVNLMWQSVLKERFGLVIHGASKDFPADELRVAKGGPKLKTTDLDPNLPAFDPSAEPIKNGADGFPQLPAPGLITMLQAGSNGPAAHMAARAQTMAQLAATLGNQLGHPVVDKTGLTGKYDFKMTFRPDASGLPPPPQPPSPAPGAGPGPPADNASEPGPNIETAVQQQLGLRLVKGKAPLHVIVIDHIEKTPTN